MSLNNLRNIGIAAHIDSGKTTLSERILYYTGKIHQIVEVRSKDGAGPTMDSMDLEREKGITIQSAATFCRWKEYDINLIDTPGHIDFTVEVERALKVLDGAVLVLCGVAGVQSQTITVDRQMRRYNVPRLTFINKVDRAGANPDKVVSQLASKLNVRPILITMPIGLEDQFRGVVDLLEMKAIYNDGANGEKLRIEEIPEHLQEEAKIRRDAIVETVSDFDDGVAEKFLGEEFVTSEELKPLIRKLTIGLYVSPVFIGTAKQNKGIQTLLDGICDYLPSPQDVKMYAFDQDNNQEQTELKADPSQPFVANAFKLEDGPYGQLTYMRVYQGSIKKGENIVNTSNGRKVKIPRLIRMHAKDMHDVDEAQAGDIVAMFGIDCSSGDTFTNGDLNYTLSTMFVPNPVMELSIHPKEKTKLDNFSKALNRFQKEDPTLQISKDEESGQTLIKGMGELHLEIYIERIKREYNCEVVVGKPKVAYRESITKRVDFNYTHKKQTGGSGQFARVAGYIEPLAEDATEAYEFSNKIVGGVIPKEYITPCDRGFQEQLEKGVLVEQPVVGIKVELNDGQTHPVDSSERAFNTAAKAAMRESLRKAGSHILEPIMKLETSAPEEFQGVVIGQISQRRGVIVNTTMDVGYAVVEANVPLKEMFGYATDLRGATQGKGEFTMEFLKYSPVPKPIQEEIIEEYQKSVENK